MSWAPPATRSPGTRRRRWSASCARPPPPAGLAALSAVGSFWGEYHWWGQADAEPGPAEAAPWTIVMRGGPTEELLCACTAGLLAGGGATTGARPGGGG